VPGTRRYRVEWTYTADQDLESIVEFIARDNVNTAIQVLDRIRKTASKLEAMPQRGRVVPELREFGIYLYREVVSPPWRIIYRLSGPKVFVVGVIDSRRNVEDILLDRLIR